MAALKASIARADWHDVAIRLNGFDKADIKRLSGELSVATAANVRAAVSEHLAGWPQQQLILDSLDAGRAEVRRIGLVYETYAKAIKALAWDEAVRQLAVMTKDDVDARLHVLSIADLTTVAGAAQQQNPSVAAACQTELNQRGAGRAAGPAASVSGGGLGITGALVVGGRYIAEVTEFERAATATVRISRPLAQGARALVGATELAEDAVVVLRVAGAAGGAGGGGAAALGVIPVIGVAVVGAAAGAAIALSPLAIAHAQAVEDVLGEFGGNLPPGGVGNGGGGPEQCRDCAEGTTPTYRPVDSLGRATGVRARIKGRPSIGSDPTVDPAGWTSGFSGQGRAHLLGKALGGSGATASNLVTFDQGVNIRMYNEVEKAVIEYAWTTPNNCISYEATPVYEGDWLVPHQIRITAWDECTGEMIANDIVTNRMLH